MANPAVDADFQIGTVLGYLDLLHDLGIPNPHPVWKASQDKVVLGDNSIRLLGYPQVAWEWGFLSQEQRDILRTYCTGGSSNVYIVTPTTEKSGGVSNVSVEYQAIMVWPAPEAPEDPQTGRRVQFVITFKQLIAV